MFYSFLCHVIVNDGIGWGRSMPHDICIHCLPSFWGWWRGKEIQFCCSYVVLLILPFSALLLGLMQHLKEKPPLSFSRASLTITHTPYLVIQPLCYHVFFSFIPLSQYIQFNFCQHFTHLTFCSSCLRV